MIKRLLAVLFTVSVFVLAASLAFAWPWGPRAKPKAKVDTPREARIDKNKDGIVEKKELIMAKKGKVAGPKAKALSWYAARADTNHDGKVDAAEVAAWNKIMEAKSDLNKDGVMDAAEKRLIWKQRGIPANTAARQRYDKNGDGWLEPAEVKEMLRDKYIVAKTNGKAIVDTEVEAQYDTNKDGVIDPDEAVAMADDIR